MRPRLALPSDLATRTARAAALALVVCGGGAAVRPARAEPAPAVRDASAGEARGESGGTSSSEREYAVKGAFLLKFIHYTSWPDSAFEDERSPIVVALFGDCPYFDVVGETLRGKKLHGRPLEVRLAGDVEGTDEVHVVYTALAGGGARTELIKRHEGTPTLLLADEDGFAKGGGTINFFLHEGRVRFAVNPDAAERSGLKISSELLKLAKIVRGWGE